MSSLEKHVPEVASLLRSPKESVALPSLEDDSCSDGSDQVADYAMEFIIQDAQGKRAKVHFVSVYDTGWPVAFCRTGAGHFHKWPKYTGWKPSDLPQGEILTQCILCFKQLSPEGLSEWSDYLS